MRWVLVSVFAVATAHSYGSSAIGYASAAPGNCAPDGACLANRKCTFGSEANYKVARDVLFEITGRSLSCVDKCSCSANPRNQVNTLLDSAVLDPTIYGNNSICTNEVVKAAMYFHTAGYKCETVFAEAQIGLFRLCGFQDGRNCLGKCDVQYKIDTPLPPCEERQGVDDTSLFIIGGYIFLSAMLWTWTNGIDLRDRNRLRTRFRSVKQAPSTSTEEMLKFLH